MNIFDKIWWCMYKPRYGKNWAWEPDACGVYFAYEKEKGKAFVFRTIGFRTYIVIGNKEFSFGRI